MSEFELIQAIIAGIISLIVGIILIIIGKNYQRIKCLLNIHTYAIYETTTKEGEIIRRIDKCIHCEQTKTII
ncbi:MAG: hypothetical protein ACFE96_15615 [Candidatus Hermodarchaeota archaeon]